MTFPDDLGSGISYGSGSSLVVVNAGSGLGSTFAIGDGTTGRVLNAVPEPSTWAMIALGFAGLGFAGWRKTRAPSASRA